MSILFMAAPVCAASDKIDIVSTTSVLWDPIQYIGGDKVNAIDISPLMMNGSDIGMHSCTIKDIGKIRTLWDYVRGWQKSIIMDL